MAPDAPLPTVTLNGKSYPLAWGNLARVRFSSLPEEIRTLGGAASDAIMVWSSLAIKPNPFLTWEHVAELICKENIAQIREALDILFPPATVEKKSVSENTPSPSSDSG